MSKPFQFQGWPESLDVPYGPYRAVIERVVDGDTVHVVVSLGLDEYAYRMIRLQGADAPELFSGPPQERERGKAARDFLAQLLPQGTKCRLLTQRDVSTFGRYVASIELEDGTDVVTALIEAGHATPR
ncbi:MAG TPA: thermonuclease family protein [Rubrobacteraceae bacterium]|nr:thermonuclease family protein [Rubrobacteraceae bacterium]